MVVRVVLAAGLVALVFFGLLPKLVDVGDVWRTLRAMTWLELLTLGLAAVWNLGSYLLPQLVALPGLTPRQAALESHTSTAVGNLVPVGQAVGLGVTYRFYSSYGFSPPEIALSLLVQGVWNNFLKLGMPLVAVSLPRRLAGREGRPAWSEATVRFRALAVQLLRARWHWLTAATLVSHLSLFLVLLLALRHVGVAESEVSWVEALAAFALVRLLSAFPITPGGLGVVEFGLAAGLVLAGGDRAQVVAAVLVFRLLTFVLPVPIGAVTWWLWRRSEGRPLARPVEVAS